MSGPARPDRNVDTLLVAVCPLRVPPAPELVADLRDEPDHTGQLVVGTVHVLLADSALDATQLRLLDTRRRSGSQLHDLVEDILDFALEFTEPGEVRLSVRPTLAGRARGVLVAIADTGIRIDVCRLPGEQDSPHAGGSRECRPGFRVRAGGGQRLDVRPARGRWHQ